MDVDKREYERWNYTTIGDAYIEEEEHIVEEYEKKEINVRLLITILVILGLIALFVTPIAVA